MQHRGLYGTDAGMHCLWDPAAFSAVCDYDTWSRELEQEQDIIRHIRAGAFLPLYIQSDGAMEVEVRVGSTSAPAVLNEREQQYLVVRSQPYLLRSSGRVCVSGVEHVSVPPADQVGTLPLPPGDYAGVAHLIAWDEEPGMQTDNGPAAGALPDYIVLLNPAVPGTTYRTKVESFDRPE